MVKIFSSSPFYTNYIHLPNDSVPDRIRSGPKFWPFFKDTIGAIDGSHIHASPHAFERGPYRNRKGFVSQNCLFTCDFKLNFTYALTGWEGSATDARIYEAAVDHDLRIPAGKYFLADAGFPLRPELLVPYRNVRYHLAEWGRVGMRYIYWYYSFYNVLIIYRPTTKEELFNLRNSSAQNVIERIFGVLKQHFRILHLSPPYSMDIQAQIPAALLSYPVLWTCFPIPIVIICSLCVSHFSRISLSSPMHRSNMVRCMDPIRCTYPVRSGPVRSDPIYDKLCKPFPVHITLYTAYSFIQ
jgi:hypothetical protein